MCLDCDIEWICDDDDGVWHTSSTRPYCTVCDKRLKATRAIVIISHKLSNGFRILAFFFCNIATTNFIRI